MIGEMPGECLFCQIVEGSRTVSVVMESEEVLAFLDHRPVFPGHCLLIPKVHLETLADLPVERVGGFFQAAQLLSQAVETALAADGSFIAINNRVSQSVPHLHVHVVPRRKKDGLRGFFWPRGKYTNEGEMEKVRAAIGEAVKRLKSGSTAP
jgi:histidine triad (HIT) family protein